MLHFFSTNQVQMVFIVCALLGGVMHYLKKYLKSETDAKIYEWYGRRNLAATVYTVTVFFFAIIGAIAADVVNSQTGFWAAMYSGFVTGFAIDAGFNGDARSMAADLSANKTALKNLFPDKSVKDQQDVLIQKQTDSIKPIDSTKSPEQSKPIYKPKPIVNQG